jgi:serine-type D-Ala-D-Ala carboxypeptidase/endopeptidase (penicillin-binding protein 4)
VVSAVARCALLVLTFVGRAVSGAAAAEPPLQHLAIEAGIDQPVYAEAEDGTVLVAQAADKAVHPASVSKVATTLALLRRLGPTYRFETTLRTDGLVRDGVLHGDLIVDGGSDPFLVYEGACLMLRRLNEHGVRHVDGSIRVRGPLLFNWQPDNDGNRFGATLAGRDGASAWSTIATLPGPAAPATLSAAALRIDRQPTEHLGSESTLVVHRSPPLLHVVKVLNGYSNNVFHLVAPHIGGTAVVNAIARDSVAAAYRDEIRIDNGAGAGTTNRLSPRAATALLAALDREVRASGHTLADVLPVSGVDPGTLDERFLEQRALVIGKTGTYGDVGSSALAGVLTTRGYGTVRFAVLNSFVPVAQARKQQDAFVRALAAATEAGSWPYGRAVRPDFTLAEVR